MSERRRRSPPAQTDAVVAEAHAAAAALRAYRQHLEQKALPEPSEDAAVPATLSGLLPTAVSHPAGAGPARAINRRRPNLAVGETADDAVMRLATPDWLFHALSVTGPDAALRSFQDAARGPGHIPWQLDHDARQEDLFLLLMQPEVGSAGLGSASAHALSQRLRILAERLDERARHDPLRRPLVPFDLHALIPMPAALLPLGPAHPDAHHWLWRHWGTTRPLRRVRVVPATLDPGRSSDATAPPWQVGFWSADWSPWPALRAVAARWPDLRFDMRPQYEPG